jgi:hypothetical protein
MEQVRGIVQQGYRVASGLTNNSPYPAGTIELQIPHLLSLPRNQSQPSTTGNFGGGLSSAYSRNHLWRPSAVDWSQGRVTDGLKAERGRSRSWLQK